MRVTNLPHILRGAGLVVVVHAGADTRGQGELAGVIESIFAHHTGSAAMPGSVNVVRDGRGDLKGLLSQLAVDPDGRWHYLGSRQAWHAGTGGPLPGIPANSANSRTIGIEGVSNGSSWTAAQRWSYPRGVAALADAFRLPTSRVVRHQDWAPRRKVDAGVWTTATFRRDVDWHRADLRRGGGGPPPPPAPRTSEDSVAIYPLPRTPGSDNPDRDTWPQTEEVINLGFVGGWHGRCLVRPAFGHPGGRIHRAFWFVHRDGAPPDVRTVVAEPGIDCPFADAPAWEAPNGGVVLVLAYSAPAGGSVHVEYER